MIDRAMLGHRKIEVQVQISNTVDDDEAVAALAAAEARADCWSRLYEDRFDATYRLVYSLGVAPADVEDVVQRTFLVAYRRLVRDGLQVDSPTAWLKGVAVRVVCEHRRWRRVRQVKQWLVKSTADEATRDRVATPEQRAEAAEMHRLVRRVLDRMRPKLRDVLVLLEVEELSPAEVARMLGIPVNTVRSRRRLARQQFERLWHQRASGPADCRRLVPGGGSADA